MARLKTDFVDTAFTIIKKKIENFDFPPGKVISDLELSRELDMSRTPIREAILQLINSGLLTRSEHKVVVTNLTINDAIEMIQVREAIEGASLKLIIKNNLLTESRKDELLDIHHQLVHSIHNYDFNQNYTLDSVFHHKIVTFSGNTRLAQIFELVDVQSQRLRWISSLTPERYVETIREHEAILRALTSNNIPSALASLEEHFSNTLDNYQFVLEQDKINKMIHALDSLSSKS